ncbi:MAG: sulfite dehydrogenase [Burkholderiaceae bacterium]|nr:sulfite dehydrogenase [Burkholderiaceae bacterium]
MKRESAIANHRPTASDPQIDSLNPTRRRVFLTRGVQVAGALAAGGVASAAAAQTRTAESIGAQLPSWMTTEGAPMRTYGQPSKFEEPVKRLVGQPFGKLAPGAGVSFTPLQSLTGTITPNGLHFERHHGGVPEIDPARHKLLIHGLVKKPLAFDVAALLRYPMVSRTYFIECSGNSFRNTLPQAQDVPCGAIHGLLSCSEWTGLPLAVLLNEAGVDAGAKWLLAEGADAAGMSRSIPLSKALDDTLIALYQNGERLRPEQGYPMRLVLPGWEGNMSVKWLHRLKLTDGPTHTRDETSRYTDLMRDGRARQFTFEVGVKSVITQPSGGMTMPGPGLHQLSGLAWSGAGRVTKVEVSADGGATWRDATLQAPVLSKSLTRFHLPWNWNGAPAMLQSRATDEKGNVQESRSAWNAQYSSANRYHNTMIQTWAVNANGSVKNAYA